MARKNYIEREFQGNIIRISINKPILGQPFFNSKYETIEPAVERDLNSYKFWREDAYVCGTVIQTIPKHGHLYLQPKTVKNIKEDIEGIIGDNADYYVHPYDDSNTRYLCDDSKKLMAKNILMYLHQKGLLKKKVSKIISMDIDSSDTIEIPFY